MSLPSYLVGWLLAFFCFKDAAKAAGGVAVWWWIPTRSSLDGGRRRRGWIQNLEELGRVPGRCAFRRWLLTPRLQQKPVCDGLLRFVAALGFFSGGNVRRRRVRVLVAREGSRGLFVFFSLFRVLCVAWWKQLSMYPPCMFLYFFVYLYFILN